MEKNNQLGYNTWSIELNDISVTNVTDNYMLDEDFNKQQLMEKFPTARTFPQITIDGESIGGYNEFRDWASVPND